MQERRDSNEKKTRDLETEIKIMEELFVRTKNENAEMKAKIEYEKKYNEDKTAEENFAKSKFRSFERPAKSQAVLNT